MLSFWQYVTDKKLNIAWKTFCLWLDMLKIHLDMDQYSHIVRILGANKIRTPLLTGNEGGLRVGKDYKHNSNLKLCLTVIAITTGLPSSMWRVLSSAISIQMHWKHRGGVIGGVTMQVQLTSL